MTNCPPCLPQAARPGTAAPCAQHDRPVAHLLPASLGGSEAGPTAVTVFVALVVVVAVLTWQVRAIRTATYPRGLVTIQMIGDLVLVGIVARVVLGAVRSGLRRQE